MYGLRFISRTERDFLERFLDEIDFDEGDSAYWAHYAALGTDDQARLGHVLADVLGMAPLTFPSPQERAFARFTKRIPTYEEPIAWIGWAGRHSNIGPAYKINPLCFPQREPVFFYTDDDLTDRDGDTRTALELARDIVSHSSGLAFSGLGAFESRYGWEGLTHYLTFTLDFSAIKPEVLIGGKARVPEHIADSYVLVLPKVGEFRCILGEVVSAREGCEGRVSADGRHTLIGLLSNGYCMK